jgi:hypothetical protein
MSEFEPAGTERDTTGDPEPAWQARPGSPHAALFGVYYPEGYLVAVLPADKAAEAVEALRQAGWAAEQARHFDGDAVLASYRRYEQERGLLEKIAGVFTSDEQLAIDEYLEEARAGRSFVVALAPSAAWVERARRVLAGRGAYGLRRYGAWTLEELPARLPPPDGPAGA